MLKRMALIISVAALTAAFVGCSKTDQVSGPVLSQQTLFSVAELGGLSLTGSEQLDLTPEQKERLQAAFKRFDEAARALMEKVKNGSVSREDAKAQFEALQKALEEEIKSILTPEQYEQWKQHRDMAHQNGGLPYPLPFPLEHLARVLEFTPEQVQQAKALIEQAQKEIRTKVESIKDPRELRNAVEEILRRTESQFRNLLTTEQAAKYDQLKKGPHSPKDQIPNPLHFPLELLARALQLTSDQVHSAQAIIEKAQKDIRSALENIKDPNELRQTVEGILRRADADFRSILTAEQAQKYEQLKKGRLDVRPPFPLPFPIEVLARELQLSPDQLQGTKRIVEVAGNAIRQAFSTIRNPEELRRVVSEILRHADERFVSILTREQAAKYEEMKMKRAGRG